MLIKNLYYQNFPYFVHCLKLYGDGLARLDLTRLDSKQFLKTRLNSTRTLGTRLNSNSFSFSFSFLFSFFIFVFIFVFFSEFSSLFLQTPQI